MRLVGKLVCLARERLKHVECIKCALALVGKCRLNVEQSAIAEQSGIVGALGKLGNACLLELGNKFKAGDSSFKRCGLYECRFHVSI